MEIGNLNKDKAFDFLCNKRAINEEITNNVYKLVGGRVGLLVSLVNKLNCGLTVDLAGFFHTQCI